MMEGLYKKLLEEVQCGNKCAMLTYLDFINDGQGAITGKYLFSSEDIAARKLSLNDEIYDQISSSLETGMLKILFKMQHKAVLVEAFSPKPRLIVFGSGHIAQPLSELAAKVGFSVTVVDDRPFFANTERFPQAEEVICESFEKSFNLIDLRKTDYVVIVTRGHQYDGLVLRKVLKYELSYIGMIGSKRRVKSMREELLNEGFNKARLDFVKAPIGLEINAITPDEIAVSIVSQLISFKNESIMDKFGKSYAFPEFDREVAEKITEKSEMPKALITVISTKGSVPRKAGSKMVAFFDGRTYGSIGGGCSEAGVISSARKIMSEKGFLIESVDLTADAAESDGMVCGGVMEVLIEVF